MSNRLLVIDDSNVHRVILCRIGEKAGFDATPAASYDEAVKLLRESEYDCITLDLSLGDRAGVEVLHFLSVINYRAPVIIISGAEDTIYEESVKIGKALKLNLCTPIPKPLDLSVLHKLLARIGQQADLQKLSRAPV